MSLPLLIPIDHPVAAPGPRACDRRPAWVLVLAAAITASGCGWRAGQTAQPDAAPIPAVVRSATVASRSASLQPVPTKASFTQRGASPSASQQLPAPGSAGPHLANFGAQRPSRDARQVADWAFDTWDNEGKSVVLVDKKSAKVYVFNPRGRLVAAAPALIGAAVGDDPVPGIGDKPLSQVLPEEKTTPAGRFVAEPGVNANGEDIVWVSWDLAVSMHRVRPLVKAERRVERLASPTAKDNRISFGCINLPVAFYEKVLRPTVTRYGAIVYVLPETRTPQEQFGSHDVRARSQVAGISRKGVK
jgi:hypothetical protein